jgi:anaerobic selenocysteine-containing dehydrogenase
MNQHAKLRIGHSACPHDCPSTCALEVELLDGNRIGRVHGAKSNTYTSGVVCAKVARYADRVHHPDRLLKPLVRAGAKGDGVWKESSWEAALDLVAEKFIAAEEKYGSETVWPYYYAGTMGLVQRDGIDRLRHAKKYSGFFGSICTNLAWTGWMMGAGALRGPDPREMAKSDCVVIWGHQCRGHAGQCDDPRHQGSQRARRQDRRHRRLRERDDEAGRYGPGAEARHRRRARLRGYACPVQGRPGRPRLPRKVHR